MTTAIIILIALALLDAFLIIASVVMEKDKGGPGMEVIVDITNGVYKERIVRCKDCRKKKGCVIFDGICDDNGYCSLSELKEAKK